ncbi:MAG: enoyl-CoA hydratase/isomerase family protein [Deltaproteobacteria bacterium]|nr:enoyl-CoA hydratase/isomerase family protein [Deltaproteobacteria bacterium]
MSAAGAPVFSLVELGRALCVPDAAEAFSPVGGPGVLAIDLEAASPEAAAPWLASIRAALPALPCVTIALGTAPSAGTGPGAAIAGPLAELAAACDVQLATRAELVPFCMGFEKTPLAALAFVQLLRAQAAAQTTPATTGGATNRGVPSAAMPEAFAEIARGLAAESFVYSTLQSGPEFHAWLATRRARRRATTGARGLAEPACLLVRDENRLELRLNRPARHNAFSRSLRDALCEGLGLALADPTIEAVVLRGEGESFCSGGDLDEFGSFPDPATAHAVRTTRSPALLVARLAGRIRSEIHGACIGAGIELPAFTDHVVAAEDTFIELPEVRLGLVPGAGGTVSITRRIGRQRTAWLGLSGRRIDARTALDWGLVDEVRLGQHPRA